MLTIYYYNITDINNDYYQLFRNAVSEERRMRADCYRFIDDSKRSICAELLLQYSVYQIFGQVTELDFAYNEFGKPYINHVHGFSYNISHSGKWVAIAYAGGEVGIDIEEIQMGNEDIVDSFFTKEEKSFINMVVGKEREKRFTQIWTLKESYLKYLGTGLLTRLNSFSVNAVDGVLINQNGEVEKGLRLKSYLFDTNYFLSVCSMEKEVILHKIKFDELLRFTSRKEK